VYTNAFVLFTAVTRAHYDCCSLNATFFTFSMNSARARSAAGVDDTLAVGDVTVAGDVVGSTGAATDTCAVTTGGACDSVGGSVTMVGVVVLAVVDGGGSTTTVAGENYKHEHNVTHARTPHHTHESHTCTHATHTHTHTRPLLSQSWVLYGSATAD
jgi:hypothetical protein